jgi:hypothetical protein
MSDSILPVYRYDGYKYLQHCKGYPEYPYSPICNAWGNNVGQLPNFR